MTRLTTQKSRLQNEHDRRYYWWRMLVKQRLYKRHRDMLIQIDKDERVVKLDETLQNVEEGYDVLLKAFDERASKVSGNGKGKEGEGDDNEDGNEASASATKKRSKRKFTVEDDDDEMEDVQPAKDRAGKKPKV